MTKSCANPTDLRYGTSPGTVVGARHIPPKGEPAVGALPDVRAIRDVMHRLDQGQFRYCQFLSVPLPRMFGLYPN